MYTNNYNDIELTNLRMAYKDEQFVQSPTDSHTAGFAKTTPQTPLPNYACYNFR